MKCDTAGAAMTKTSDIAEQARSLLDYDQQTGLFVWKPRPRSMFGYKHHFVAWNSRYANKPAGTMVKGYVSIKIANAPHSAHRIAWLLTYGEWPEADIDHINGIRWDNRISNLRSVSRLINSRNRIANKRMVEYLNQMPPATR